MLKKIIQYISYFFLFLLPWQTILITQERFINGAKWEYGTLGVYGTEVLGWVLVLLFMVWYIGRLRTTDYRLQTFSWSRDRIFVLSLLLFTSYGLLITFFSGDQLLASQHAHRILLGSLLFLLFFIGPIKPKPALWAFVLGSIPVSILGIWQFLAQSTFSSTFLGLSQYIVSEPGSSIIASESIGRWLRAYGSFSHPNVFGGYLVFGILSSLLLYRSSRSFGKILVHAIVVLQVVALFCTFSRSAWTALLIGLLVYISSSLRSGSSPFLRGRLGGGCSQVRQPHPNPCLPAGKAPLRKGRGFLFPYISVVVLFFMLSAIYFPLVQTRFFPTSQNEVTSITERVAGYDQALQLFQDNMWFGVGGGNYTHALIESVPDMPGWWYQPVHVVPLLMLVEVGLIGIALFGFVLVSFARLRTPDYRQYLLLATYYLPLVMLDHYLWSSYIGIMLIISFLALFFRNKNNEVETSLR